MGRMLVLLYGVVSYVVFFLTFLYALGFVGNIYVSKGIDTGTDGPLITSVLINLILLSVFCDSAHDNGATEVQGLGNPNDS